MTLDEQVEKLGASIESLIDERDALAADREHLRTVMLRQTKTCTEHVTALIAAEAEVERLRADNSTLCARLGLGTGEPQRAIVMGERLYNGRLIPEFSGLISQRAHAETSTETIARLTRDLAEARRERDVAQSNFGKASRYVEACDVSERDRLNEALADLATLKELLRESNDRETGEDSKPLHDEGCEALGSWPHAEDECDCALGAWRARVAKALGKESGT